MILLKHQERKEVAMKITKMIEVIAKVIAATAALITSITALLSVILR